MAQVQAKTISSFRALWTTIRKSWALFRHSKLGVAGTVIIATFVFMAIFAPIISPFSPEFLAPNVDIFVPVNFNKTYKPEGTFYPPVVGPSAPKDPQAAGGRLWIIVAHDTGLIEMDNITKNNVSLPGARPIISLRIKDFDLATPISNVLYLVPGRNINGGFNSSDDLRRDGLLAFVANHTLVLLDPFTRLIHSKNDIGFQPKWFVEDPVSAGEMYEFPQTLGEGGIPPYYASYHTYRYIVAANDTHLSVFRVNYRSNQDSPPIPLGEVVRIIDVDMPVTGIPLAYYLQLRIFNSGIFIPTSNSRLTVYDFNNTVRHDIDLSLDNESASVCAPIGYIRAPEKQLLYIPLKSQNKTGIGYLVPRNTTTGSFTFKATLVFNDPNATVAFQPDPGNAESPHFVLNHEVNGTIVGSDMLRSTPDGQLDPILNIHLSKPLIAFFYSPTNSAVLGLDTTGIVWTAPTVSQTSLRQGLINFFENSRLEEPDPARRYLLYMGSWGGTEYTTQFSSEEILGLMFLPSTGNAIAFKLLGQSIAPLPPGKYASGNTYYLGTDDQGHDILTQLIWGSRVALEVGLLAAFFSVVIGTLVGLVAGFYGGLLDTVLMRLTDIALVLPFLPLVLILASILGPSVWNIIIVIAVLGWPGIARVIRAQTLSLKERPFIDAARISGASRSRTMIVHVAPNVLPFAFLYMTLNVGGAILTEAAVSFLGLGDPRPQNVSWGIMLRTIQSSGNTLTAWWWLLPPGLCITIISLGFYLVGRAIDEIINPRLRER